MAADQTNIVRADLRPLLARGLLWGTVLAGTAGLIWSLVGLRDSANWLTILVVLCAAILAEWLKVSIYETRAQTLSFTLSVVVIMAAITIDPLLAPLVGLTAAVLHVVARRQRAATKIVFNLANLAFAAVGASWVYVWLRPAGPGFGFGHLLAATASVITYFLLNHGGISAMISLHSGRSFGTALRESTYWFGPTSILMGLTGAYLGGINDLLGLVGTIMFVVPLLLMRFTLSFYAKRSQATIKTLEVHAERLDHQARHDALTGLPNRVELQDRMDNRLAVGSGQPLALLMMDLDRFQEINDTFGHHHGDLLLKEIGPRLRGALLETDLIARLGGDEFAVLLLTADAAFASATAEHLLNALQDAFVVDGHRLEIGASIGIAVAPPDGPDAATLLRRADVAMYAAKRDRSGFAHYAAAQDGYNPERLALVGDLRHAIDVGELILHFQPKVDLRSGLTTGAEALVRWRHPQRGLIAPDDFIPLAEHTGLIKPLTRWVLDASLRQCHAWLNAGWDLSVAVNASVHDLHDPTFPDMVGHLLAAHSVPARYLRVEVTEGAMMANITRTHEILARVRDLGAGVSIDDFGTGYSSLAYLKRLPVNELKIDRSFVRNLATDAGDVAIMRATVALGHDLGLTVVAEGAEDLATLDMLRALGCDAVQGYVMSKPLPVGEFMCWLASRAADHARSMAEAA
jgi:diguanylate cyclase (GGDEF)-like protein